MEDPAADGPAEWPIHWEVHWEVRPKGNPDVLSDARVIEVAQAALLHGGRDGAALSVVFVDDERLSAMHADYLGDASPTDVITFDLGEEGVGPVGELYISVDCGERVAAERSVSLERELALYVVHGALHLCGFDDHEPVERAAMRAAEREVLEGLGFAPDPLPHDS